MDDPIDKIIPVGKYMSALREHIGAHGAAWVEGELSEHKTRSGHWYFTITDPTSALKCVMWKSRSQNVGFKLEPGQLLRVYGRPTVYPKYCILQFDVLKIVRRPTMGELQKRFLELQKKFAQEGLFEAHRKMPLPQIPHCIGIVTSGEGAALQDILRILRDRFPAVQVILASVRVQGPHAAPEMITAIQQFNQLSCEKRPDLLIIGRGGGSLEDLWAFNEEGLVRAISESRIPIISAVGHETDTTIADLVADVRAATPTHAAQTAVPERSSLIRIIQNHEHQMFQSVIRKSQANQQKIVQIISSYTFNSPINYVRDAQQSLNNFIDLLHEGYSARIQSAKHRIELLQGKITASDPRTLLARGFTRIERKNKVVRYSAELNANDRIQIHFQDGSREAIVRN